MTLHHPAVFLPIVFMLLSCVEHARATEKTRLTESQLLGLLQKEHRFKEDILRDADRRPAKILKFSELAVGDTVLDLYAGGGWYSEILSMAVGPNGKVFAHNDSLTWRFGGKEMMSRTRRNRLANVTRLDQIPIAEINVANSSVDIAYMTINYHDLFFTTRVRDGQPEKMRNDVVDYKKALANVREKLKDKGLLIITDHMATPGSGYQAANDLHRIDPNIVKYQLKQAGFTLLEEAFYLRNPKDDLGALVFNPQVRGKTSRFIYKFGKNRAKAE